MLVSDSHKFVFHHVPKTAGSSITAALAPYCNMWKGTLPEEKHGWQVKLHRIGMHLPVREVMDSVDDFPSGYFSFAFVRNPFEVIVSAWDSEKYKDFDSYIEHEVFTGLQICARRTQFEYLTAEDGKLLVDFVGRYENLAQDFYEVVGTIGVPLMILPKRNITKDKVHDSYREYYSPVSRHLIEKKYKKDLEYFGYEF